MSGGVLQRLLSSGEYDEIEDIVTAEGEFIESTQEHVVTRQVFLGMTANNLIIAFRQLVNYNLEPAVFYETDVDLDIDGLDVSSVWPLCVIQMAFSTSKYEMTVNMYHVTRHYEMTNTHLNGNMEGTWARWQERILYLRNDPYHYIRDMYDEYHLPYPSYFKPQKEEISKQRRAKTVVTESKLPPSQIHVHEETEVKHRKRKHKKRKKT